MGHRHFCNEGHRSCRCFSQMLLQNSLELQDSSNQLFEGIYLMIQSEITVKSDEFQVHEVREPLLLWMHYTDTIEIHSRTAYMVSMKSLNLDTNSTTSNISAARLHNYRSALLSLRKSRDQLYYPQKVFW